MLWAVVPADPDLVDRLGLTSIRQFSPTGLLPALFATLMSAFRRCAALQLEILALRHQLGVLQPSVKRPKLIAPDRFLWAWLSWVWADWRSALVIVKPETVIGWHRKRFRVFWTWKRRRGQPGRPAVYTTASTRGRWVRRTDTIAPSRSALLHQSPVVSPNPPI